ncbi:regulatory protein RecX [Lujinxingia sediminis]|uniref:Regulatory protein RecX n=1 Tax=Lujinxingia sediminis TaxID=2480984 RepID=A0ABY0CTU2_9DELT|nr:regulatory protein RecX [Lujinxingia sediminis]RVU45743.1 regulatory protein RecX [Lujinxingia sediminis]
MKSEPKEHTRDDVEAAAYRFLARRDHACGELRQKLGRYDFEPELVEEVLSELVERGYLDDARFAETQGQALARKGWGPSQIAHRLRQRGVDTVHIDAVLDLVESEESFRARASAYLFGKFGAPETLDERTQRRAFRHMLYRGYAPGVVRRLLFDT